MGRSNRGVVFCKMKIKAEVGITSYETIFKTSNILASFCQKLSRGTKCSKISGSFFMGDQADIAGGFLNISLSRQCFKKFWLNRLDMPLITCREGWVLDESCYLMRSWVHPFPPTLTTEFNFVCCSPCSYTLPSECMIKHITSWNLFGMYSFANNLRRVSSVTTGTARRIRNGAMRNAMYIYRVLENKWLRE